MDTQKITQEYRMNQWIRIIQECRASGQTVATWCVDHDINPKSYYYWLKKVRIAACSALPATNSGTQIVPLDLQKLSPSVPVDATTIPSEASPADVVIRLGSAVLEIHNNATQSLIENIIRALNNVR